MADSERLQNPRPQVELRSAVAELLVLRRAIEVARAEARSAKVSAHRAEKAEKALARERAKTAELRKKWKSAEKWRKEHNRVTSSLVWRAYSLLDWARHRVRLRLRGRSHPLDPKSESELCSVEKLDVAEILTEAESKPKPANFSGGLSTKAASSPTYQIPDLSSLRALKPRGRIAVVLHLYYPELWPEFRDALSALSEPFDLFVTLTVGYSDEAADWIRADYPSARIVTLENRGRDILPFVILINSGVLFHYDLVCKLHSKRSMHMDSGDTWRRELVGGVLSDFNRVAGILADFDTDRDLGIVVAKGCVRNDSRDWSRHSHRVNELCDRIGMSSVSVESGYPEFPAGSIFWIRASLLRPIANLRLTATDFEPEPLPIHSCTPHAIERFVGHVCREAGMHFAVSGEAERDVD